MDLRGIGWGGVDWIGLVQDRDKWRALVNAAMNLRVHNILGDSPAPRVVPSPIQLGS
jgi:hypothetical protein